MDSLPLPAWTLSALLALGAPVLASVGSLVFPRLSRSGAIAISGMAISLLAAMLLTIGVATNGPREVSVPWVQFTGISFRLGFAVDGISAAMLVLVSAVSLLVMVFSKAYMHHDPFIHRYWAYLSFFCAAMIGLVLAESLIGMFICWELVGVSSWLLIGFWNNRPGPARASQQAFLLNRIGDAAFIAGIMLILANGGPGRISGLGEWAATTEANLTLISLLLFGGSIAKSAQFPLQIWLPNAMEGPTPVSSLIHAATMVAAGVYLVIRAFPLFTPEALAVVGSVGLVTSLLAGLSALTQWDIKRLLAMSTLSQLGLMYLALGAAAPEMAFFHLMTHAFMKSALFLMAGIIIHQYHHALGASDLPGFRTEGAHDIRLPLVQDMRVMGGLLRWMPVVFWISVVPIVSMAGVPFTAGYLSKEGIFGAVLHQAMGGSRLAGLWFAGGLSVSVLTAAYLARMVYLVFFGENRLLARMGAHHPERMPDIERELRHPSALMYLPVALLAVGSWFIPYGLNPFHPDEAWPVRLVAHPAFSGAPFWLPLLTLAAIGTGVAMAYVQCRQPDSIRFVRSGWLYRLLHHHFFQEKIYTRFIFSPALKLSRFFRAWDERVVDGTVNTAGRMLVNGRMNWPYLAAFFGWWDERIVDGFVRLVFGFFGKMGQRVKALQSGRVQWYISLTLVLFIALIGMLIWAT
jgi:NADH-quinone oxidoreductase subunit L